MSVTQAFLNNLRLQLVEYSPYSSYLALSNFGLFPNVKNQMKRRLLPNKEELLRGTRCVG